MAFSSPLRIRSGSHLSSSNNFDFSSLCSRPPNSRHIEPWGESGRRKLGVKVVSGSHCSDNDNLPRANFSGTRSQRAPSQRGIGKTLCPRSLASPKIPWGHIVDAIGCIIESIPPFSLVVSACPLKMLGSSRHHRRGSICASSRRSTGCRRGGS